MKSENKNYATESCLDQRE